MTKYYVFNSNRSQPTYVHDTYEEALKEAQRLAKLENDNFEILKVVAEVEIEKRLRVKEFLKEVMGDE